MAYKRVLAKALRNTEGIGTPTSKTVTPQDKSRTATPYSPGKLYKHTSLTDIVSILMNISKLYRPVSFLYRKLDYTKCFTDS